MNIFYKRRKELYQIIDCYVDENQENKILYKHKDKDIFFIRKAKDFFKNFKKTYL